MRQNEETKKYDPNKRRKQNPEEELRKMELGDLPNKGFEAKVIKNLSEFIKRMNTAKSLTERNFKEKPNSAKGYHN